MRGEGGKGGGGDLDGDHMLRGVLDASLADDVTHGAENLISRLQGRRVIVEHLNQKVEDLSEI